MFILSEIREAASTPGVTNSVKDFLKSARCRRPFAATEATLGTSDGRQQPWADWFLFTAVKLFYGLLALAFDNVTMRPWLARLFTACFFVTYSSAQAEKRGGDGPIDTEARELLAGAAQSSRLSHVTERISAWQLPKTVDWLSVNVEPTKRYLGVMTQAVALVLLFLWLFRDLRHRGRQALLFTVVDSSLESFLLHFEHDLALNANPYEQQWIASASVRDMRPPEMKDAAAAFALPFFERHADYVTRGEVLAALAAGLERSHLACLTARDVGVPANLTAIRVEESTAGMSAFGKYYACPEWMANAAPTGAAGGGGVLLFDAYTGMPVQPWPALLAAASEARLEMSYDVFDADAAALVRKLCHVAGPAAACLRVHHGLV